jgi:Rrf2 family protein
MRLALTRRADYAVRAMLLLATEPAELRSGTKLARTTGIPAPFVGQVMGDLAQAGLVETRVGRSGGYRLARPAERISMLSIVEAVEGDTRRRKCVLRNTLCGSDPHCPVHNVFAGAQEALIERLAAASLANAMNSGPHNGPAPAAGEIAVRRVRPSDKPALLDFYAGLSPDTSYARFLGFTRGMGEERARSFCTPDHMHDAGFVALAKVADGAGKREELVGHLCLEPAGPHRLELAIAVADSHQGRGIGRQLMVAALTWAQSRGVEAIIATAFADNFRVLRLLTSAPFPVQVTSADGGVVDVVIPLVPELLPDKPTRLPADLRASQRRRGSHQPLKVSRCSRVVWRGKRQPGHAAEDSASTGSN